jgi:hypothetical protein
VVNGGLTPQALGSGGGLPLSVLRHGRSAESEGAGRLRSITGCMTCSYGGVARLSGRSPLGPVCTRLGCSGGTRPGGPGLGNNARRSAIPGQTTFGCQFRLTRGYWHGS